MLKHLAMEELAERDMLPQAILRRPVADLANQLGEPLLEAFDDLDVYQGIALQLNGETQFALKHYKGHPAGTTTVYLSSQISEIETITRLVARIADELHLSGRDVLWQRKDDPDL
jgi:hypothetical protein